MKQTSIYTAALAAALMLISAACSDQQYDNDRTPGQQPGAPGPLITVTATQGDRPQTRLGYVDHDDISKPIEVTWAEGDKFYVGKDWPAFSDELFLSEMTEYFSPFTLKEGGAGSKNAEFEGNTLAGMQNGDKLYAIYGDGEARIVPSMQESGTLLFGYRYPEQTANDDQSHLSATDFMIASTTYTTGQQPVFAFTHLGAMMKFTLTLPTAGLTVKQLKLTTTDKSKPFSETAQWNKDGALAFSNGYSNSKQLLLSLGELLGPGITLTDTKVLTAYMMVAPTTLTKDTAPIAGKELKLEVTDADDVVYTATLTGAEIEQGKYYTVEAELKIPADKMSFTIQVDAETGMEYTIPFPTEGTIPADITVDWGDKSEVTKMATGTELTKSNTFSHPYNEAGRYTITITSSQPDATEQQIPGLKFYDNTQLISMDTPMLNIGETSFYSTFYYCSNLTKLSNGLFDKNMQATDFAYCFTNCTGLTELPEDLFDKNTEATYFAYCFDGCTGLTELPTGLFNNNTQATNFSYCFYNCTNLTELPTGLFNNNTQATNFSYCFYNCSSLVLSNDIFSSTASANRFEGQVMLFSNCFENTGSELTPQQQEGSVAPRLWEYTGAATWTTTYYCYTGCKAGNLTGVPTGWGTPAN